MIYAHMIKLIVSAILSGLIGYNREKADKAAGLRTLMLTSVSCTLFTLVPFYLLEFSSNFDFSRVIAYLTMAIGFLGSGVIIHTRKSSEGVTTAATIFASAALGVVVGLGQFGIAFFYTALIFVILKLKGLEIKWKK